MKTLLELHTVHSKEANVLINVGLRNLHAAGITKPEQLTAHVLDTTVGVGASTARGLAVILAIEVARQNRLLAHIANVLENNK